MRRHYTVLIFDDKGSTLREALVSKRLMALLTVIVIMAISITGIGAYQYIRLKWAVAEKPYLQEQLEKQRAGIENQRKQIQSFAQAINDLKNNLVSLNEFERKIRIMANLEQKPDQASLFSMGGPLPEDLDTDLPLKADHDRLLRQMHDQIRQCDQATLVRQNSLEALLNALKDKRNILAATPSLRPTQGWVSSSFGYRTSPFTGRKELHKGMDIANRQGTPIIAPADGMVTYSDNKWLMGNMITIDHGYGILTRYGHMHKLIKKAGERVKRGETIALMGTTGRSTGPHLHYEVRLNGVPVDPDQYILD
ncbi:MAG: hypothetical protein VR64_08550 [Desulfatitalea sp. BRH_c12]|nr:MAG: hypothetical protein VR64_08550 [Desulfatitalea sp. BRH_c12]